MGTREEGGASQWTPRPLLTICFADHIHSKLRNFTKDDETRFVDSIPVTGDELDMMRLSPECERVGLTNGCDDFCETLTVQDDRARRRVLDRVPIRRITRSRERVGPLSTCNEVLGRCAERCGKTLHLWQASCLDAR